MKIKIISYNGYYLGVSKDVKIKESDLCFYDHLGLGKIKTIFNTLCYVTLPIRNKGSITQPLYQIKEKCFKVIIASPELNLNVPSIPNWEQWEVEQLANNYAMGDGKEICFQRKDGFIAGYNHNKKLYTEEDLRRAFGFFAFASASQQPYNESELADKFSKFLQSLKKVPEYLILNEQSQIIRQI